MKTTLLTETNGSGFWSSKKAKIQVNEILVNYVNEEGTFGELLVSLDICDWNDEEDGLVYTDDKWIESFRSELVRIGFSKDSVQDVDYSEAGMQQPQYVSLDVGALFLADPMLADELSTAPTV